MSKTDDLGGTITPWRTGISVPGPSCPLFPEGGGVDPGGKRQRRGEVLGLLSESK